MDKKTIKKLQAALEREKIHIEEGLKRFAKKDEKHPENWNARFPKIDDKPGSEGMEAAADEVEEYSTLLPIEYSMETRLRDVNIALGKIKNGGYGICEKCKKEISIERLNVAPEARSCLVCKK